MVDAVVLAGGYSSRAKTNKMTLDYLGKPLIMHAIETAHLTCERIIVVTGHYHDELVELLEKLDFVTLVRNLDYDSGMFSSIRMGLMFVENDFFIIPGDYPKIKSSTYQHLLKATGDIRVPSCCHRLGHPIFFKRTYKNYILETTCDNLKDFRNTHEYTIVEVEDPGIVIDIDNQDDYKNLLRKD